VAELRVAFNRSADFPPRSIKTAELAQGIAEIVPRHAFVRQITDLDVLVPVCR
jgi:hypothetical protein